MDWPIYYKDRLQIGNLDSQIGIITLWTPAEVLSSRINPELFCVAGQLYSKRGINFLIRNILARPQINHILICGADLSGSSQALINFLEKGIDKDRNVLEVENAKVDDEIEDDYLEEFRKNVTYTDKIGISNFNELEEELKKLQINKKPNIKSWIEPKVFPLPEKTVAEKFPSEKSTFTVRASYIKEAWPQILRNIMKFGSSKGMIKVGEVKELTNMIAVIEEEDPNTPSIPEWFPFDKKELAQYYKNFFSKETKDEDYNYGQRIFSHPLGLPAYELNSQNNNKKRDEFNEITSNKFQEEAYNLINISINQLEEIYIKLKRYKYDRGAVISIWNPWIDNISKGWMSDKKGQKAGNVPCMTQLQFAYRNRRLHLTAYFRSNDMFDAWPRNTFALRKLQFELAKKLGVKPGYLTTISSLAQIYEGNYEEAQKILEKFNNITNCRPDHRGSVIIELEDKEIVVRHMDETGNEELQEFRVDGTGLNSAQKMSDILMTNLIFSEIPHAMDIARELQKAEIAVKNNLTFRQDRELKIK